MAQKKEYTVICHHRGKTREFTGTLEHLTTKVFGYTLEAGASYSNQKGCRKVNTNPKTGKSLINALNNATHNRMCGCLHRDWYELKEA